MARSRSRLAARAALALVATLDLAPFAAAQVAFPEEIDFHNTTYVGDEPEAARLAFYRADEHRKADRPKDAGREVLKLLRGETSGRVRFDDRLVVPVETAALLLLATLPPEVRAELAREEAALEPPLPRDPDPAALRRFAARHPLSAEAETAWLRAGTHALLAGDAAAAAADLERVVHWPIAALPNERSARTRALAAARLLEAHARLGELPPRPPLARWPDAGDVVERGDRRTAILELVESAFERPPPPRLDATTLFGDDARSPRPPFSEQRPLATVVLRHVAPDSPRVRPELALHRQRFRRPTDADGPDDDVDLKDLPIRAPLVLGDRLVTIERVTARDGTDAIRNAPYEIHVRAIADGRDLFAPIRTDFDLHLDPREVVILPDRIALSARGSRLAVTFELRDADRPIRDVFRTGDTATTALYVLDLAREGFVEAGVTSEELATDPQLAGYVLAGPAVEQGGRLLVAASRLVGKETECALLAFDAASGDPVGVTLLARASAIPMFSDRFVEDETRRVNPSPIALRDGTAYVCTNLGVIAAVRAADLEAAWLFRYHRMVSPESDRYERASQIDLGPWIGRAPVALADRVLASPSDSLYLYSLARWPSAKGHLLLNDPIEKQARVCWLGADEQECWFLTRQGGRDGVTQSVMATDHNGAWHWMTPALPGGVTGVPALTSRFLFLPTDRCIYRLDLREEGRFDLALAPPPEVGIPYPAVGTFGDLAVSGRVLVSTSQLFTILFQPPAE